MRKTLEVSDLKKIAEKILKGITNTMSDRCIVQKKQFNELLQEYRAEVLPSVVGGWEDLTSEQQSKLTTMNNYFCRLHYIVGLADQAQECLRKWEEVHFDGKAFGATELASPIRPPQQGQQGLCGHPASLILTGPWGVGASSKARTKCCTIKHLTYSISASDA